MRALIFEPRDFSADAIQLLRDNKVDVVLNDRFTIEEALENFEIIYLRFLVSIDKELLFRIKTLACKYLVVPATGTDHVDETACKARGIAVVSFRNDKSKLTSVTATAELTIALILLLYRNLPAAVSSVKQGQWNRELFKGFDIHGKNAAVIGYGRLGTIVARYLNAFGATVAAYDKRQDVVYPDYVIVKESLYTLVENADIITVHIDYTRDNENLFDRNFFSQCTGRPIFINTSRGALVREADLLWALDNQLLRGAALDVLKNEPYINDTNELVDYSRRNNNLVITPHLGGCTFDSSTKTENIITQELIGHIQQYAE